MFKFRLAHLGLALAATALVAAAPLAGFAPARAAAQGRENVRAEVAKPVLEAQKLALAGKSREALAKLREADGVAGKSAAETYQIERLRASAAAAAGDNEAAIHAFESVLNSGRLPAADVPKFTQALAGMYYRAKDWPKAITWINRSLKDADTPQMRELLLQSYYLSGNYAAAAKQLQAETAGHGASESQLQMLANIAHKQNDKAAYIATLEKLAANHPKPSYWADLLSRVSTKPGFSDRLALDVARLKLVHGLVSKPADYMEIAQLALLAGNPAEAVHVVEQGYKSGALGNGNNVARHQRLKDLAARDLADSVKNAAATEAELVRNKEADKLAALGFALVSQGNAAHGLALMNQALRMGGLKYPEEARLHLGIAYANAGKKPEALAALKAVQGKDGSADLARYWILQLNRAA
ncbi:MAG: hypothetical protein H7Z39_21200 [Burkholderiaceae bacterium]|nr:hypothetical protein [Burkholderiaceae bacterium]